MLKLSLINGNIAFVMLAYITAIEETEVYRETNGVTLGTQRPKGTVIRTTHRAEYYVDLPTSTVHDMLLLAGLK